MPNAKRLNSWLLGLGVVLAMLGGLQRQTRGLP